MAAGKRSGGVEQAADEHQYPGTTPAWIHIHGRLPARQPLGCGHLRDARDRGKDHPHAVRILARAWIYVIWRCWHDGTAYDPAKHDALQRILARQHAA